MQPPPGYVAVAYAEQKWAEREAEFSQRIAQLQALVENQPEGAGSTDDTASEAAEQVPVDKLEEDDTWNQIERRKRKALLGCEREKLVTKVRANLSKVCASASPFRK